MLRYFFVVVLGVSFIVALSAMGMYGEDEPMGACWIDNPLGRVLLFYSVVVFWNSCSICLSIRCSIVRCVCCSFSIVLFVCLSVFLLFYLFVYQVFMDWLKTKREIWFGHLSNAPPISSVS